MTAFTTVPMSALAAQTATITGTVRTTDGAPVGSAGVVLQGPTRMTTTTDASGKFNFSNVTPGAYTLVVSKAGFQRYEDDNLVALGGESTTVDVALAEATFSTLRTIANVSTTARGHATLNTSSAAVSTISDQVFQEQGVTQVTKILNETPGIISGASPENGNGAHEGSFQNIQIRGALPYETEQLIDGHPTTLSLGGTYDPIYLNPALLQRVEVVKGPGSMPEEINYAIGGTVNYITLQPTRTPEASATLGYDNWGGVTTAFKATGSIPSHKLDYAFGYATNGAPGPLRNYPIAGSQIYLIAGAPPWTLNGHQVAQLPQGFGPYPPSANLTGIGGVQFNDPMYVCCWNINTAFHSRGQTRQDSREFLPGDLAYAELSRGTSFQRRGRHGHGLAVSHRHHARMLSRFLHRRRATTDRCPPDRRYRSICRRFFRNTNPCSKICIRRSSAHPSARSPCWRGILRRPIVISTTSKRRPTDRTRSAELPGAECWYVQPATRGT